MNIEAVLVNTEPIIESDARNYGTTYNASDRGPGYKPHQMDWKVWSGAGYGQRVASALGNLGKGYSFEVSDMGKCISVRAAYHNTATGRGVEKTYIIYFDSVKKGDGTVFATSTRWRTVSNPEQAASYISMSIKGYASTTSGV